MADGPDWGRARPGIASAPLLAYADREEGGGGDEMPDTSIRGARRRSDEAGNWRSRLARTGLVGKGLFFATLGLLAVEVAVGAAASADQGAVERVAQAPFGRFLLIVLALTLVALVAWKGLQTVTGDPVEGSEPLDRVRYAIRTVGYGATALSAVVLLLVNWGQSPPGAEGTTNGEAEEEAAGVVMEWPAGRWIVAAAGLVVIGAGLHQIYRHAVQARFLRRLDVPGEAQRLVEAAGRAGYAARAGAIVGVGIFLVSAGVTHDDDDATGLSGLLSELADETWGQTALWALGVGLVLFGGFSLAEARYRRAT